MIISGDKISGVPNLQFGDAPGYHLSEGSGRLEGSGDILFRGHLVPGTSYLSFFFAPAFCGLNFRCQQLNKVSPEFPRNSRWFSLGAQTTKLIHENVHVGEVHQLEEFVLDANVIEDIFNHPDPKKVKALEKTLIKRFKKHAGNPKFKALSERQEELRDKAEKGLIASIEFVKELCKLAKETLQAEKEVEQALQEKTPQAALTELFLEIKTDQTPAVVERIVTDIDAIVRIVRFPGWQKTSSGEREVQKSLRKALLKYKLHKDQVLFDRAYAYIKEYY